MPGRICFLSPLIAAVALLNSSFAVAADFTSIPRGNSNLYYQLGGGNLLPLPASSSFSSLYLNADAEIGLGYNCGVFNPKLALTNTINDIKGSLQNTANQVIQNATAAIAHLPMYVLARANPTLYNLLNNHVIRASEEVQIATKNCEVMQQQTLQGENPYSEWLSVSIGNNWKKQMGIGGDITQAKAKVEETAGDDGIPWVDKSNAGGKGQPAINVITDTVTAGFKVLAPASINNIGDYNSNLLHYWPNATLASSWITAAVGEQQIQTFDKGNKTTIAGKGLLPSNQQQAEEVANSLQQLMTNDASLAPMELMAISAPGVAVTPEVILALREKNPLEQQILSQRLATEVATAITIDKALVAKKLLQVGYQSPAIAASPPAKRIITQAIEFINQEINDLLFTANVRRNLAASTLGVIVNDYYQQQYQSMQLLPTTAAASE